MAKYSQLSAAESMSVAPVATLGEYRFNFSVNVFKSGTLYIIGGQDQSKASLKSVHQLDLQKKSFRNGPRLQ